MRTTTLLLVAVALAAAASACGDDAPADRARPVVAADPPAQRDSLTVGGAPNGVTVGAGAVWVIDAARGRLLEVAPDGLRRRGEALRIEAPLAVTTGEGAVWVLTGTGRVLRVDPRTRRLLRSPVVVREPGDIAAGLGAVWVTSRGDDTVVRLDPRSGRAAGRPVRVGDAPSDVAIGFGAVWVANTQAGTVSRINPGSGRQVVTEEVADERVLALSTGVGAVWTAVTDSPQNAPVALRPLDPDSGEVRDGGDVRLPTGLPIRLAAGLGSVWATDVGNLLPGTPARSPGLIRVSPDPPTLVGSTIPIGEQPTDVATGAGAVWVTSASEGTLLRIVPGRLRR